MGQHLFLTGFRGTGKTSVGRILATDLGWPLVDLDEKIQQDAGQSIAAIFRDGGETLFRQRESMALAEVAEGPRSVIALGGGAILREANRQLIRASGHCFWLDADPAILVRRIKSDTATAAQRPALTSLPEDDEVRQILQQRQPLYEAAADHRIDTSDKTPQQVAAVIIALHSQHRGGSGFCQQPSPR